MLFARMLREVRYLLEYLLLLPFVILIRRASEARSRVLARGLSRILYRLMTFDRQWALKNLELVFGDQLTPSQRTRLAMAAFENNVLTAVESLRWTPEWMAANVIVEGGPEFRRLLRESADQGKGLIVITAHLGNFELVTASVYLSGTKGTVLYRAQNNWRVDRLVAGQRRQYVHHIVARNAWGLLKLRAALRRREVVGTAIDQNTPESHVFVDFLGYQAASPPGAAVLALATGAPVVLVVSLRGRDGRHRVVVHPPFELIRTGDREHDIRANTQQYTRAIEPYVLAYPEQYNWPHPRWRLRPDGTNWQWYTPTEKMAAECLTPRRTCRPAPTPLSRAA